MEGVSSTAIEDTAIESAIAPTVIVGLVICSIVVGIVSQFNLIEPGDELGEPGDKGWSDIGERICVAGMSLEDAEERGADGVPRTAGGIRGVFEEVGGGGDVNGKNSKRAE